jgi:hypothetical protein
VTLAVNNSPAAYDGTAKSATVTISASSTPGSVANILTGGAASQTAADTYAVTADFVPTNTNYNTLTAQSAGNFVVSKATPSVTTWPTASAITSGQALSASALTGGNASVAGGFAFESPDTIPPVGTHAEAVIFTPTNAANYLTVTGSVNVVVKPPTRTPTKSGAWGDPATWGGTVPAPGDDVVLPSGITVTLAGPIGPFANLTIAGTLNLGTNTLQVSGNLTITGTFNPGTGTVELIGGGDQTLAATAPGTLTFYKLAINKGSATATVTAKSKLKASKKLTITKGKLISASDYGDVLIETDGTLKLTSDITIAGDLVVQGDGTLTTDGHKITFDGGVVQNLTLEYWVSFDDLTVTAGTTLVETESANNVMVNGTLLNQGVIRKLQVLDAAEYYNFGLAGNYAAADMEIRVTARTGGTPLTAIQVDRIDANHPQAPGTNTTGIYWTITPTGSDFVANIVLPQNGLSDPQVCRYRNSAWDWARSEFDPNTVTRTGLTAFGDLAVFDTPDPQLIPPTAVADPVTRSAQGVTKIAVAQLLLNDSDPLGRTLTLSSVSAGSGGTVALSGRWITFTPADGLADATPATFTYVLSNGTASTASATVTLNAPGTSYNTSPATLLAGGIVNNPGGPGKVLTFAAIPNFIYVVEVSGDLNAWTPLGSFTAGADGRLVIPDTGATEAARFYRFKK